MVFLSNVPNSPHFPPRPAPRHAAPPSTTFRVAAPPRTRRRPPCPTPWAQLQTQISDPTEPPEPLKPAPKTRPSIQNSGGRRHTEFESSPASNPREVRHTPHREAPQPDSPRATATVVSVSLRNVITIRTNTAVVTSPLPPYRLTPCPTGIPEAQHPVPLTNLKHPTRSIPRTSSRQAPGYPARGHSRPMRPAHVHPANGLPPCANELREPM
jgi:hypothetical protein